jgi:5,6-dimethylbenzimidazole synthase
MTKAYGIAGLRLGFAWMPEDKLRQLIDRRIPWTVNSLAQAAGLAALEDQDYYAAEIEQLHQAKREFVDELAVHGFQAVPSDTGFFLLPVESACRAREALLREAMVVRDCRSFGLDGYLRIAVLQPASNRRLTQALVRCTSGGPVPELPTQEPETPMATRQAWPNDFCQELHQLFRLRRDVRHFRPEPLPAGALRRWVEAACLAPSVGLSQPWRFVTIDSPEVRARVIAEFETQNRLAAEAYDDVTAQHYQSLKLAGLREAPEHLAVLVDEAVCEGRGLGRATMPETIDYSVVAAIQNLWLAARAEGVGIGWVSILRPAVVAELIAVPPAWRLIAYLCIGYPQVARDDRPLLERQDWEYRQRWEHIWHQR